MARASNATSATLTSGASRVPPADTGTPGRSNTTKPGTELSSRISGPPGRGSPVMPSPISALRHRSAPGSGGPWLPARPGPKAGQDLHLVPEAGQAVSGGPLMLEGQRQHPPAVLVGRQRRRQRGYGALAEDLGEQRQRPGRGPERDREPGSAGLEVGRPLPPEPGQFEAGRTLERLRQHAGRGDAPSPEDPDGRRARARGHEVPDARL